MRFKAAYRPGHEIATVNRALSTLRAAINWGRFQGSALLGHISCRQGEMLRIQNRRVDWERHQIVIPGQNAKDGENQRIPFDPNGRLAPVLKRRASLGPHAFVFGTAAGEFQERFKTACESLLLVANGYETKRLKPGLWTERDRARLRQI